MLDRLSVRLTVLPLYRILVYLRVYTICTYLRLLVNKHISFSAYLLCS